MLKLGEIEPLKPRKCLPLLLVKKTYGKMCPLVDFRQLNRATTFEPMPNPEALFIALSKDHVFNKPDCSKGYCQIVMHA